MKDKTKLILELPITDEYIDSDCDILGFRIKNSEEVQILKGLLPHIKKPLMIRDCADGDLLPEIMEILDRECIIGIITENNYKNIVPKAVENKHTVIIRTPIDINLAKEMNILTSDMGLEKIIIDTDIGGIGYGFEYGYSIMEKIKIEGKNDKYLNKPIISFAAEETAKTKEAKDINMEKYLEIAAVSAVLAAGADYIVCNTPDAINTLRSLL